MWGKLKAIYFSPQKTLEKEPGLKQLKCEVNKSGPCYGSFGDDTRIGVQFLAKCKIKKPEKIPRQELVFNPNTTQGVVAEKKKNTR